MNTPAKEPIAIVGIAARFPGCADIDDFWERLFRCEVAFAELAAHRVLSAAPPPAQLNGSFFEHVDRFDADFFAMSPEEARRTDPQHRFLLEVSWAAVEDAGYRASALAGEGFAVFVGLVNDDYATLMRRNGGDADGLTFAERVLSSAPSRIAKVLGAGGPCEAIESACTTSLSALHRACGALALGECTTALVASASLLIGPDSLRAFAEIEALSADGSCLVFDEDSRGTVLGEGAVAVVLKPLSAALADGDVILGSIVGSALRQAARSPSLVAADFDAIALAARAAAAHVPAGSIGYILSQGTATPAADARELRSALRGFGPAAMTRPAVGSIKPGFGHLEAAAGLGAVAAALGALRAGRIPPVPGVLHPNGHVTNAAVIPGDVIPWPAGAAARCAAVTGFGYGGLHAALVLAEAPAPAPAPAPDERTLILLSAYDEAALNRRAADLVTFLASADEAAAASLADIARTLRTGREPMSHRIAVIAAGKSELSDLLVKRIAGHSVRDRVWEGIAESAALHDFGDASEDVAYLEALAANKKLEKLATLWIAGVDVGRVEGLDGKGRRIRLPAYRFEGARYWSSRVRPGAAPGAIGKTPEITPATPSAAPQSSAAAASVSAASASAPDIPDAIRAVLRRVLGRSADRPSALKRTPGEAGIDSIAALRLRAGWQETLGLAVPVASILDARSIAELLAHVRSGQAGAAPMQSEAIVPDEPARYDPFPLSEIQLAYFLGRGGTFAMGGTDCRVYFEFERANLDVRRLCVAWDRVVERHDMLRVVITEDARQHIRRASAPTEIPVYDVGTNEARRAALREELAAGGFDAPEAPPYQFSISRNGTVDRLHVAFNLMALDAASLFLVMTEWAALYDNPGIALPQLPPIGYRDYVLALERRREQPDYQADLAWWKNRLDELPPPPQLPLRPAPEAEAGPVRFRHDATHLAAADWQALRECCVRRGLTAPVVLIAAFAEALAAVAASPRFTINVTVQHRLPLHAHIGSVVGDFTSGVLLAVEPGSGLAFWARAGRIARRLAEDLEHLSVGAATVVGLLARSGGGASPIVFTSVLGLSAAEGELRADRLGRLVYLVTQTPQVTLDVQAMDIEEGILLSADSRVGSYPEGLPERLLSAMAERLRELARDESAWETGPPAGFALHEPFVERAESEPDRVALIAADRRLSYGELLAASRRTADAIRRAGGTSDFPAAIVMRKGWEQIVAALAASLAGVPYLPVDADLPPQRIAELCALGAVRVALVAHNDQPGAIPAAITVISVGDPAAEGNGNPVERPDPVDPDRLAYVIYTSGSTGTPKGVVMRHAAAANTIADVNRRFGMSPADRVLAVSSLSFDLSVWDIFGVLATGGAIVLPDPVSLHDPAALAELMRSEGVTIWNSVPSLLQLVLPALAARPPAGLRTILLSGDTIPVPLARAVRDLLPATRLVSLGGATEAGIWSITHPIGPDDLTDAAIPYGRALAGQSIHILDGDLMPCPVDVAGDLYIGGASLAEGYWRDPERTAQRFIRHPSSSERLYFTGDRGSRRADGVIRFLGRSDNQVKIGGFRVELGEVEAALATLAGVAESAAATLTDQDGQTRLIAAVRPAHPGDLDVKAALTALRSRLPAYMIPAKLLTLERFPLNGNGKVDRRAIARLAHQRDAHQHEPDISAAGLDDEAIMRGVLATALSDARERAAFAAARLAIVEPDHPADLALPANAAGAAPQERRTHRRFALGTPNDDVLSRLGTLLGLLSMRTQDGPPRFRYPSAGSTYAVRTYVRLAAGTHMYRYDQRAHRLHVAGPAEPVAVHLPANAAIAQTAAFELYFVADLDAVVPLYGPLSKNLALVEAGYIGQLLMDGASQAGLGLCPIGWVGFEAVRRALGLSRSCTYLHGFLGGIVAEAAVGAESVRAPVTAQSHAVAPAGKTVETVRAIWHELLGHAQFGDDDNFFEVGGTSFSIVALQRRIEDELDVSCRVTDLFLHPTVDRLAAFLTPADPREPAPVPAPASATPSADGGPSSLLLVFDQRKRRLEARAAVPI